MCVYCTFNMHFTQGRYSILSPVILFTRLWTPLLTFIHILSACSSLKADIVFLLDASTSVSARHFAEEKDFVLAFLNNLDIGPQVARLSVVTFDTDPHGQFDLNSYRNKQALEAAINNVPYTPGSTNTAAGIAYIIQNSFIHAAGDRPDAQNILVVVTDGNSNDPVQTEAEALKLHQEPIRTFAIGVGEGVSSHELGSIATDAKHVFRVDNFDALHTLQEELSHATCGGG
jgi:secreted protein with Ig-like and vWFA domain